MNSARFVNWILPAIVTVLALADGALHLTLDFVLFRGNFLGRLGPPPGAPPPPANRPPGPLVPLPLPLNQMFLLNAIGYLVLVALLWFALTRFPAWRRWVCGVLVVYVAAAFLSWVDLGAPNPMGLGYLSKAVEIVLIISLVVEVWLLSRAASSRSATPSSDQAVLAR